MQHKVSKLSGALLDVAVALAEARRVAPHPSTPGWWLVLDPVQREWHTIMEAPDTVDPTVWSPSTKWEHGGPIIERESIATHRVEYSDGSLREWAAGPSRGMEDARTWTGPTPLIAAMRAYVASKFGETVELP